ncbi:MAG: GNAT family N-acetyltransferase [Alphaproteobacteria bacterium]|nr:GNAT family N-acetyltransferase [Alphaproteobacteria bacterium]
MRKIFLKKGKLFLMRELTLRDVEKSHNLLNLVAEEMKGKGKEEYIISKSKDKIAAIIDDDNNKMVGIFLLDEKRKEKQLVAEMGYFGVPEDSVRDESGDFLPNFNADAISNSELDYIGSVCVHPEFRGMGLFKDMDSFLEEGSKRRYSVATVEITNYKSFGHFLDAGFLLTQTTVDPFDNANIFYLVKDKEERFNFSINKKNMIPVKVDESLYCEKIAKIKKDEEIIGSIFDKKTKTMWFSKSPELIEKLGNKKPSLSFSANKNKGLGHESVIS